MKGQQAFHPISEGDGASRPRRAGSLLRRCSARRRWPTPWQQAAMGTPVAMKAETTRRPLLPACANTLRMKCTRQRSAMKGQQAFHPLSEGDRARRPWRGRGENLRDGGLDALVRIGDHQFDAMNGQEAIHPIGEAGAASRPRRASHAGRAGGESRSRRFRPPRRRSSCRALRAGRRC